MGAVKKGFTLIEVMVVISVIALVVPALFYMVFMILLQQVKIYRLSEAKRQGDFALTAITSNIRNSAVSIYDANNTTELCSGTGDVSDVGKFRDQYDNWFSYTLISGKISSGSSILNTTTDLTKQNVTISDMTLKCYKTASFSPSIVEVKFTITAGDAAARTEEKASLVYQTRVKLRSY